MAMHLRPIDLGQLRRSVIARKLMAGTLWSAFGEGAARGLMLVALVIVARILSTETYGEFGLIRTTIMTFATLGGMGLGLTANRYIAEFKEKDPRYSGELIGSTYLLAMASGGIVGLCVFATSGQLAISILGHAELQTSLQLAAALIVLTSINGAQIGVLQGLEAFRALAFANLVQGVVAVVCLVAGSYFFGLNGAVAGLLAYTLVGLVIYQLLIRSELARYGIRVASRYPKRMMPVFWRFSVPAALMGIAIAPFKWISESLLAKESGFAELGIFHAAFVMANIFIAAVSTMNGPLISAMARSGRSESAVSLRLISLYAGWVIFVVLSLPFLLFPELLSIPFGDEFRTSEFHSAGLLLIFYCGLLLYYQGVLRIVTQHGAMWMTLLTNIVEGVSLIVGFYLLSDLGAVGLGGAYVISYLARIGISVPLLVQTRIVTVSDLLNRYFIASLLGVAAIVAFHLASGQ